MSSSDSRPTTPGGSIEPHEPVFKVSLKENVELLEGTTVRFELVVRAMPYATLTFFKDDKPLDEENERIRVVYESPEIFEIVLQHVTAEDSGHYTVVAVNSEGQATTSGTILVTKDKVLFQGLSDEELEQDFGAEQTLSSDINVSELLNSRLTVGDRPGSSRSGTPGLTGHRSPAFRWFRDGSEFDASERFQCQFDDCEDTIALVFQHVTPDDAGLYTCVASTTSGKMSCSAELTVQGDVHRLMRDPEKPALLSAISEVVQAAAGSSAMLEAKVAGFPFPKVSWYKDDDEVVADDRHKFLKEDEESYTLVVKNVKPEDAGTYTLKAENELGGVETSGQLVVNSPPKFTQNLAAQQAMAGEPLKLEVKVEASPEPEVFWYKDGQLVEPSDRVKLVHGADGQYALEIQGSKVTDAGSYSVVVSNTCGQQTGFGKVTVSQVASFSSKLDDYDGHVGDTAEFKVKVVGSPKPQVQFLNEATRTVITTDERVTIHEDADGVTYRLVIKKVTTDDIGVITCVTSNEYGSQECSGRLALKSIPIFKRGLNDCEAREGDVDMDFTVIIEGSPKPKVTWSYQLTEITESEVFTFVEEKDGSHHLRISSVSEAMAGTYTCSAVNSEGTASSSGQLTVNAKPKLTCDLKDAVLVPGKELVFKCKASGQPAPVVSWTKDGKVIVADGSKVKVSGGELTGGEYTLTIADADDSDVGEYAVIATNPFGSVTSAAKVTGLKVPKFKVGLKDVAATQDEEDIVLSVQLDAQSVKAQINWFVDDIEIVSADKRYQITGDPGTDTYTLKVKQANEGTAGTYKCRARNDAGQADCSAEFTVVLQPDVLQGLEDREVIEGESILMDIVVAGNPIPEVTFLKDGKRIDTTTSGAAIEKESDLVYMLTIDKASLASSGVYEVIVKNRVGEARSKGELKVLTKPVFKEDLSAKSGQEGEDAFIEVVVDGTPRPSITWFRDGNKIPTTVMAEHTDNKYKLRFEPLEQGDDADYHCTARNKVGTTTSQKCHFTVERAPVVEEPVTPEIVEEPKVIEKPKVKEEPKVKEVEKVRAPTFKQNLSATQTMAGEPLKLEVKVDSSTKPEVSWYKDGQLVVANDRVKLIEGEDGLFSLVVADSNGKDAGNYSCVISNAGGQLKGEAKVTVNELPSFSSKMTDVECLDGDTAEFKVKVTGSPKSQVKFYRTSSGESTRTEISTDSDSMVSVREDADGTYTLVIRKVTTADLGVITCVTSNTFGSQECTSKLGVTQRKSAPVFVRGLKDSVAREGGQELWDMDMDFSALIEGSPRPEVKWFYEDSELVENEVYTFEESSKDGSRHLRIKNVSSDMSGTYTCEATNSEGQARSSAKLTVNAKPKIISDLSDAILVPEEDLILKCKLKGFPAPDIKWTKNGKDVVVLGSRVKVSGPDSSGEYTLLLTKTRESDVGEYTMTARNKFGSVISTCRVTAAKGSQVITEVIRSSEVKARETTSYERTTVVYQETELISNSHYQQGPDTYLLQHRDTGYPLRIREYLRVGSQRSPGLAAQLREGHWGDSNTGYGFSPQVAVRERRKFVTVMDEEIDDEKAGRDTRMTPMRLTREIGTGGYAYGQIHVLKQEAKAYLNDRSVKVGGMVPPVFREKIKDTIVRENEEAVFSVLAIGDPSPSYTWFRNDGILIESPRIEITTKPTGRCELRLKPARAYDVGCFKCVARNEYGAVVCRAKLKLGTTPARPEPPTLGDSSDNQIYAVWSPPRFDGHAPVLNYALEHQAVEAETWTPAGDNIGQEFFLLRGLNADTAYVLRVRARNKFGWGEWSFPSGFMKTKPSGQETSKVLNVPKWRRAAAVISDAPEDPELPLIPDLDYGVETHPVPLTEAEAAQVVSFGAEIARGRFSVIASATLNATNAQVIVKATLTEGQAESGIRHEYDILKSLANERIVRLLAASASSTLTTLVLEPLSGLDVMTFLSLRGHFSEDVVAKVIQDVLDGLEYLHWKGICLLELQPDNVVAISPRRADFKLVDFATARRVPVGGVKVDGPFEAEFVAPEVHKRQEVSVATDVWAIGVLTYILLSGASPFKGTTVEETVENVAFVRYHFDHLYPQVTQEAIRFLMLVFKRTPSKRPTLEECSDHKWLLPDEYMTKKRQSALFDGHDLEQFAAEHRARKAEKCPVKLLTAVGLN